MSIVVSRQGRDARKLEPVAISQEEYLQRYIYDNPEALPLDEIRDDLRLLILAREFPTRSGSIDAVGVDQDGELYVLETKLYKNPDKRIVLAQVLDYGASLWRSFADPDAFITQLDETARRQGGVGIRERLQAFFGLDDLGVARLLEAAGVNQRNGQFQFVVLMDRLDDRLKDLIVFINQNSRFSVFGVELEFYVHDAFEILVPKLYGAELRKEISGEGLGGGRKRWDERSYFEEAGAHLPPEQMEALRKLYDFSQRHADEVSWGTGAKTGSFNVKFTSLSRKSLCTVTSDGSLFFNFQWLAGEPTNPILSRLAHELGIKAGLKMPDDYLQRFVRLAVAQWAPHVDTITEIIRTSVIQPPSMRGEQQDGSGSGANVS